VPSREQHDLLLRHALKPRDFWWTVIVIDPIAVRLLPALVRTRWISPTGISLAALTIGAASVVSFAWGALFAGAIIYQVRFLLDCLDGKLARVTGRASEWGRFVDLAGDTVTIGAAYAALGYHAMSEQVEGAWTILLLLPTFALAVWLHQYQRGVWSDGSSGEGHEHAPGRVRVWSWSRLNRYPGSVEVETLVLLVFPVALPLDWFPGIAAIASLFYLVSSAEVVRDLRRQLRTAGSAEPPE